MAHQPMLLPDPSERPFLPEGSFAPARGPEWLEEDSGNYLAELAAKLASHGGGESSADLALDLMLNKIVDQARLATAASGAAIALSRDGEMVCRASVGESAPGLGVRLNTRSGVSGACVQRKELQRCDDAENDPRVDAAACRDAEIRSILAVPILEGQELLGVLEVFASRTKAFDDTDVYAVQALSRRIVENLRRLRSLPRAQRPSTTLTFMRYKHYPGESSKIFGAQMMWRPQLRRNLKNKDPLRSRSQLLPP